MKKEVIQNFIDVNGQKISKESIKEIKIVYVIFLVLTTLLLFYSEGYLGIIIISLFFIIQHIYNNIIIIKSEFNLISGVISYNMSLLFFIVAFNSFIYAVQKLLNQYNSMILVLIILGEVVFLLLGCYLSYISIKNEKVKKYNKDNPLLIPSIATLSGCWYLFLKTYLSKHSIEIQFLVLITSFVIGVCVMAFLLGKIYIPMLYFVKKYNIEHINRIEQ